MTTIEKGWKVVDRMLASDAETAEDAVAEGITFNHEYGEAIAALLSYGMPGQEQRVADLLADMLREYADARA